MKEEHRHIYEQRIANGYFLNSTVCLRAGWQMFRSQFRLFGTYVLLIPLLGTLLDLLGLGAGPVLIYYFFVSPLMYAGLYLAAAKVYQKETLTFQDFFLALRGKVWALILNNLINIIILALVISPIALVLHKAGYIEWYQELMALSSNTSVLVDPPDPPELTPTESTTFFLTLIPLVYLQVAFSWAYPFILFWNLGPWKALEVSRRLLNKKWNAQFMLLLSFFSLLFSAAILLSPLSTISAVAGNIASFALFLLFPWAYCSLYFGWRTTLYPEELENM